MEEDGELLNGGDGDAMDRSRIGVTGQAPTPTRACPPIQPTT